MSLRNLQGLSSELGIQQELSPHDGPARDEPLNQGFCENTRRLLFEFRRSEVGDEKLGHLSSEGTRLDVVWNRMELCYT